MFEIIVFLIFAYIAYFFVIPMLFKEKYWLAEKTAEIKTNNFRISFGKLNNLDKKPQIQKKLGYHLSAIKSWPRGPLEIAFTSSISSKELESAITKLSKDTCTVNFKRAQFHFSKGKLVKLRLKKTLFYISVNCENEDMLNSFKNALFKLSSECA